ncbi:hypothetical protein TRV_01436 [Trichophyton verrucosum HKI 0517]|uniref:Uncharacterized protein n=1 Tax=Trichophyton verrucosum (strain HKI 0517) TaxID=663202 RepID=D4D2Y0_TRIVH|nr:uncharacterized protein TRV_01436 [Trichophyton verrucosum HKI 0517]EFE43759.1 hypothetical protein TRV_01436 [Trichophyton verrucosum HKI 0517]
MTNKVPFCRFDRLTKHDCCLKRLYFNPTKRQSKPGKCARPKEEEEERKRQEEEEEKHLERRTRKEKDEKLDETKNDEKKNDERRRLKQ